MDVALVATPVCKAGVFGHWGFESLPPHMSFTDDNTARQLYSYINATKRGEKYVGPLNDEAKQVIAECGNDLGKLETEAYYINLFDNTLFG